MTGDFFTSRVDSLKKGKTEKTDKVRKTVSKITSGHYITEEIVRKKMVKHSENTSKSTSSTQKRMSTQKKKVEKPKNRKHGESQEPGPSNYVPPKGQRKNIPVEFES